MQKIALAQLPLINVVKCGPGWSRTSDQEDFYGYPVSTRFGGFNKFVQFQVVWNTICAFLCHLKESGGHKSIIPCSDKSKRIFPPAHCCCLNAPIVCALQEG